MSIDNAPIKKPILDGKPVEAQGWLQWFSSIGDLLKGSFVGVKTLKGTNLPSGERLQVALVGKTLSIYANLPSGDYTGAIVELPYKCYNGQRIDVFADNNHTFASVTSNKNLNLNITTVTTSLQIQGVLILGEE